MIEYDEYRIELQNLQGSIDELRETLNIASLKAQIEELDDEASKPGFFDDMSRSQKILQKSKNLKDKVEKFENLQTTYEDTLVLIDMANEEDDETMLDEVTEAVNVIKSTLETMTLETLLSGEYDSNNAILSLHAGAGGTEAQDWAEMLLRMYTRWAERKGFTIEVLDYLDGDEACIKSVTFQVNGENA